MFELPDAKRIRREDLGASDDSAWSEGGDDDDDGRDAELRAKLNAQIARSLGLVDEGSQPRDVTMGQPHSAAGQPSDQPAGMEQPQEEEARIEDEDEDAGREEFAFRLFSTTRPSQTVVLEADVEPRGEGGLAAPRPLLYYTVTDLPPRLRQEYEFAAVSGDDVLERSRARSWGLEMPWRVTQVTVTRKAKPGETSQQREEDVFKRRRPSKKQRILLRKRTKVKEEKAKVQAQKLVEKEEHIKDKKKRMNRLKKLRKRAKNKEMKQAGKNGESGGGGDSGDESGGSD